MKKLAMAWRGAIRSRCCARATWVPVMMAAALLALAPAAASAATEELRVMVGGPDQSQAHRLADLLADPLAEVLGRPVTVEHVPGEDGIAAARAVIETAPDGGTLLLADNLLLAVNEATGAWPLDLDELRPVAKLTLGISVAVVARAGSDVASWRALLDRARHDGLRLSVPAASAAHHVARAMLERAAGKPFEVVEVADEQASLADVARGRADLGLITTNDIRTRSAAAGADLRPVVTFGARRSPLYPDTPTFAEVTGDYKNDFTYSFALFGPPKLDEDLTRNLAQAALTACARPAALIGAGEANLPLACREPEVLEQTLERDLQVARRAYPDAR